MRGPWLVRMRWLDLLFAHWPIDRDRLATMLPPVPGLEPDTFDGTAWIGVVPFTMADVAVRGLPALPRFSRFPEINVRTYVHYRSSPGIWFLSLDTTSRPMVAIGRRLFHVPYRRASIETSRTDRGVRMSSTLDGSKTSFTVAFQPIGDPWQASPRSFEAWATDRGRVFAQDRARNMWRTEIDHGPWMLQRAEATIEPSPLIRSLGIEEGPKPPRLLYSAATLVHGWLPERLDRRGPEEPVRGS